jgi:DNA uptake protein ComE-like DNA-binding protein
LGSFEKIVYIVYDMSNIRKQALELVDQALKEFENNRAAKLLENKNIMIWCEVNLGNEFYTSRLKNFIERNIALNSIKNEKTKNAEKVKEEYEKSLSTMLKVGLVGSDKNNLMTFPTISIEEINCKADEAGGGYHSIGFLEEKYIALKKRSNDGTIYLGNLTKHIQLIRTRGHKKAAALHKELSTDKSIENSFAVLKNAVEDKLFDVNAELAEKIILVFKSVESENKEEWSQALVTCRRFLEELADFLYPATENKIGGRVLGQSNYINRIWAFMDERIESASNKDLAKAHIDFLGSYLQRTYRLTNKGVHADIDRTEAVKTVFHTYLIVIDLLSYIKIDGKTTSEKKNINDATIDELEIILGIRRNLAKEIVKIRIEKGSITVDLIKEIKGIGKKAIDLAIDKFEIE